MAQHLSPEELIDLVEDRARLLGAGRAAHLESCQSCRQQVQELRGVILEASDLPVPEPSPLFWEHSSKRLFEAVAVDARSHQGRWWERLSLSHMATAITTATVSLAVVLGAPRPSGRRSGVSMRRTASPSKGWLASRKTSRLTSLPIGRYFSPWPMLSNGRMVRPNSSWLIRGRSAVRCSN